jgi:hypothetical protein
MHEIIDIEIVKSDLLKNISHKYGIDYNLLLDELNNLRHLKTVKSKYSCDHYFFSRNNEQSFYWAGFIAADGCVFKRNNDSKQLIISLAEKDLHHLNMFKNHINYDGIISSSTTKHSLTNPKWNDSKKNTLSIASAQLFEDLKRFNIIPNKTLVYSMPKWLISHELANHFIRGYFDGDGCIWFHKGLTPKAGIEFRGTLDMLNQIKLVLENEIHINSKVLPKISNGIHQIKFSGNRICYEIKDFLYKNATVYMKRKFDLSELIEVKRKKYSNRLGQ